MRTIISNKIHEIKQKGVVRTFSDTFSGIFWSNGHILSSPHETHKPITATPKTNPQHQTEAVMQTRGLGLVPQLIDAVSSRNDKGYGRPHHRPGMGPGPWNSFFYQPYDHRNPYSSLPPFMGGGPIAYVGYLLSSVFYYIQEFFYRLVSYGPGAYPPPRERPSLFRPPGRRYY
ncbi:uncharacterized protein LOC135848029 [Planococcus citri]|uniref:uncharacterized protein LOC135848029 n=1 Tax=Planococcus citri TaxID=170843 RepID=UPI0031F77A8E